MTFARLRTIGRRGAYLVSMGALYTLFGTGLVFRSSGVTPDYYGVIELVGPLHAWGIVWVAAGLTACVAAFVPRVHAHRLRPVGFAGLMAMATIWAIGILASYVLPGRTLTHPWIVASLFGSLMASTAVVAGWPEELP